MRRPSSWLIENAVVELSTPRRLLMVFRTRVGAIYASRSFDGGKTWGEAGPLGLPALPNPNSKIDMIRVTRCKLDPGLKAPGFQKLQPNERETYFQLETWFLSLRH